MVTSEKPASTSAGVQRHPGELGESVAPIPTPTTLRLRRFVPYQIYRFARVNLRMIKMIRHSHGG